MKVAYILRGLPGSGKSWLAKRLAGNNGIVCSTDDFFTVRGEYQFNPAMLGIAHSWNLFAFEMSIQRGAQVVVCDNVNVRRRDFAPYLQAALAHGYRVKIVSLPPLDLEVLAGRTVHGVPISTIRNMLLAWED